MSELSLEPNREIGALPAILDEPCPCDDCRHFTRCARSGEACEAFGKYIYGKEWSVAPRQPDIRIARRFKL